MPGRRWEAHSGGRPLIAVAGARWGDVSGGRGRGRGSGGARRTKGGGEEARGRGRGSRVRWPAAAREEWAAAGAR
jgi:hypothetical protein